MELGDAPGEIHDFVLAEDYDSLFKQVEARRIDLKHKSELLDFCTKERFRLLEQLEAAQKALRNIAVWAEQELLHGPPELGLILGEARIALESSPAKTEGPETYSEAVSDSSPAKRPPS